MPYNETPTKGERMFAKNRREDPFLDQAIEEAVRMLDSNAEDYLAKVEGVERLYKLKEQSGSQVSPDTLAIVAGNLVGILMILHYEKLNVAASKAMSFVLKLK